MPDTTHLGALNLRLSHERGYLAQAKTEKEIAIRKVWIAQIEKEIAREMDFLGEKCELAVDMSDDDLLSALNA